VRFRSMSICRRASRPGSTVSMGEAAYSLLPVLAQALAQAMERGAFRGPVARAASRAWALAFEVGLANVVRPLALPDGVPVIAVGGATLGGSGKTPLAVACARSFGQRGARVALVGHAYRARPRAARVVTTDDSLAEVGDDALVCARALAPYAGCAVVVAKRREQAIELAARWADVLILDGVLQTCPSPAALSLLALDGDEPWGHARSTPPCGDLRAPQAALLAACDLVVPVQDSHDGEPSSGGEATQTARQTSRGVWFARPDGTERLTSWAEIRGLKVGLVSVSARPDRVLRSLGRRGVAPVRVIRARDHGPISSAFAREGGVDVWLATPKCSEHLRRAPTFGIIDHAVELSPGLKERLEQAACHKRAWRGPGAPP
jgi:tetraacyldisaccharide 4'-kinase